MSSGLIVLLEISFILVLALGWAASELIGLRRYRKKQAFEALAQASMAEPARQAMLTDAPGPTAADTSPGESGIKRA